MEILTFVAVVASTLFLAAMLGLTYRKVRRIDREVWDLQKRLDHAGWWVFRQIEALDALNALLRPAVPLPATSGAAASPDFLLAIARHALQEKPEVIFECSCGTSTVVLARCAQLNGRGHVLSLEHEPKYAQITRENLRAQGLASFATVVDAPLEPQLVDGETCAWYRLPADLPGAIDLLVIDGPPAYLEPLARLPAGPLLFPRMRAGGVAYLDDANRDGEKAVVQRWRSAFPQMQAERLDFEKGGVRLGF